MYTHDADITKMVEELLDEPLTHLMLGHRELFHSNLLAWFFENLEVPSDAVFKQLTPEVVAKNNDVKRQVYREADHLDLWFQWPNRRPLVIENKVFSLPDEEQLRDYIPKIFRLSKKFKLGTASAWLLSLSNPNWENTYQKDSNWLVHKKVIRHPKDGDLEWHWLSYEKLADLIRQELPPENVRVSYEVDTMRRYAKFVEGLSKLAESVVVRGQNETVALPEYVERALKSHDPHSPTARLRVSLSKLRAASIVPFVEKALRENNVGHTKVETKLTNSQPLIDWFGSILGEQYWQAGWQLQGDQFRLAIRANPEKLKTDKRGRTKSEEFAKTRPGYFDFKDLDKILNTETEGSAPIDKEFNGYEPDFSCRYKKISKTFTVGTLTAAACTVANKVRII
jgi:hypothetical protein